MYKSEDDPGTPLPISLCFIEGVDYKLSALEMLSLGGHEAAPSI